MSGVYLFFGVVIPYAAGAIFVFGLLYRIWRWAGTPVPFRIPTTSGQQKSLPWIKSSFLENPHNTLGVIGRMALEVLLFRSLLRNTTVELKQKTKKLIYSESLGLWLAALAFHWAMLIILLRHLRFFTEPIPAVVLGLQSLDGVFEIAVPTLFITDIIILLALSYLILRRIVQSQVRFISLPSDYVAVLLILSVVFSGLLMRFFYKVDIVAVKELALGVVTFSPATPPEALGFSFYLHLLLFCALLAYFPFSKMVHMAGVFLSPTRNMANNNRMRRHVNPWDYPVKVHTYEEYEDEFRDVMKAAGMPLDKE
jgi:nitrate reductase gamma subunit